MATKLGNSAISPEIYSSRDSVVTINSVQVEGIQSIDWKVNRQRSDVYGTGQDVRLGVEYGVKLISGTIRVKSTIDELDKKLVEIGVKESMFPMSIVLQKAGGVGITGDAAKGTFEFAFEGCYVDSVERSMDVNGVPISTYLFTATEVTPK
jgi:hypothetical protein